MKVKSTKNLNSGRCINIWTQPIRATIRRDVHQPNDAPDPIFKEGEDVYVIGAIIGVYEELMYLVYAGDLEALDRDDVDEVEAFEIYAQEVDVWDWDRIAAFTENNGNQS